MRIGVVFPTLEVTDPGAIRDYAQAAEDLGYATCAPGSMWSVPTSAAAPTGRGQPPCRPFMNPWCCSATWPRSPNDWSWSPGYWHWRNARRCWWPNKPPRSTCCQGVGCALAWGWAGSSRSSVRSTRPSPTGAGGSRSSSRFCEPCSPRRWSPSLAAGMTWMQWGLLRCRPRPIPIWIGGQADAALRRVAALGDGWMPMIGPQQAQRDGFISRLRTYALERGRDPASIGIDPILSLAHGGPVPRAMRRCGPWWSRCATWRSGRRWARPMSRSTPWARLLGPRSTLTSSSSSRKWSTQRPTLAAFD